MSRGRDLPQTNTRTEYFKLSGGMDLVSPHLLIAPGSALDAYNYEPGLYGGYKKCLGFERFDGRSSPSLGNYYLLPCTIVGTIAVGAKITGLTHGYTAVVLQVNASELVVTKITGNFVIGETLQVGAITVATMTGLPSKNGGITGDIDAVYKALAADNYRADIQVVPGSGVIRGVWLYNDITYCFRDDVGATAGVMYKSTGIGWSAVALGSEVQFSTGVSQINDGDTVTGFTSGATGVVKRVVLQSGLWGTTAAGYLVFATITGTFQAAELIKISGVTKCTAVGANAAITLPPGGRYEFVNFNFTGSTATTRMYGCNGVGNAFEFDGTTWVKLRTGMVVDTPNMITAHRSMLFLAFNGSLQFSSVGLPYQWSVIVGAGELGMGDAITGLQSQPGSTSTATLLVLTRHQAYLLNGTSSANFVLSLFSLDIGGIQYTAQNIGSAIFMDDRGLIDMNTSKNFGNFDQSTISRMIQPLIDAKRSLITASCVVRGKNQYRLFCSDGTGFIMSLTTGMSNMGQVTYGYQFTQLCYNKAVRCISSSQTSSGAEAIFFGSDDGYVYQAEMGTTFDGIAMQYWLRLPFHHSKSPRIRKRYRKAVFEMGADSYATLKINAEFGYCDQDIATHPLQNLTTAGLGGYWDSINWDEFYWDARIVSELEVSLSGTANNISLTIYGNAKELPHTLQGIILHYTPRRLTR